MATIMAVSNSEGTRRCDGTCHTAKRPKCVCVCGGRYHGVGSTTTAQEMLTRDWFGAAFTNELKEAVRTGNRTLYRQLQKAASDAVANRTSLEDAAW